MSSSFRGPYFDTTASKNVTALVGKTAYLNCRVRNLGNRTVSQIYAFGNLSKSKFWNAGKGGSLLMCEVLWPIFEL